MANLLRKEAQVKITIELPDEIAQRFVIATLGLGVGGITSSNTADVTGYVMVTVRNAIQAQPQAAVEQRLESMEKKLNVIFSKWPFVGLE